MFAPTTRTAAGLTEENGMGIEYTPALLDDIRRLVVDGFNALSHGGLETGGVLYGVREPNRIVLVSFAELSCEYSLGPGFVLSENDRTALSCLLQPPPGLETVGWFRAHTRARLELDADDRAMFDVYFAPARSVALLLKPTHWGPAEAAFFLRDASGDVLPAAACTFIIDALKTDPAKAPPAGIEPAPPRNCDDLAPAELEIRATNPKLVRTLGICAALLVMIAALAYWSRPSRKLDLQARAITPGQVRIQWNQRSKPVLDGASGVLEIKDGESSTTIPLDHERIRSSTVTYTLSTGRLIIRLLVIPQRPGAPFTRDAIEFVGPPPPPTALAETRRYPAPPRVTIESTALAAAHETAAPPPTVQPPSPVRDREEQPRRIATLPAPRSSGSKADSAVLLPPPAVSTGPAASNAMPDFLAHSATLPAPSLPPAPVPAPAKGPAYNGPRSGRLIWTGSLPRRGVIEIDGTRVSLGSLAGSLPGVPLSFRVLPSEFRPQGLVAYTDDPAKAGQVESPAKSNGWNGIHFELDTGRARELVVLEAPNGTNDFSRLVVRNEGRPWSVVVIDWSVPPAP